MEAENRTIVELRPELKRIMEESKETSAQAKAVLQFAASAATQEQQIAEVDVSQEAAANSAPATPAKSQPKEEKRVRLPYQSPWTFGMPIEKSGRPIPDGKRGAK
jgi:hypothetical protein